MPIVDSSSMSRARVQTRIGWSATGGDDWQERGGPLVNPQSRCGDGTGTGATRDRPRGCGPPNDGKSRRARVRNAAPACWERKSVWIAVEPALILALAFMR